METTTCCFILEAMIKIITQGLWMHKNAYLRDGWNIVDFVVVLISVFEITVTIIGIDIGSSGIRGLRALRVIRPLRSVKRIPRLKRLANIMLRSLPELGNTLVFLLFFFLVYGITSAAPPSSLAPVLCACMRCAYACERVIVGFIKSPLVPPPPPPPAAAFSCSAARCSAAVW